MIEKEEILEMSHGGLDFYRLVIPDLEVIGNRCKNTFNPFYEDKNASLSIYFNDGEWYFKDHGEPEYQGDVIEFAALYFKLDCKKNFPEILDKMHEALINAELPELEHKPFENTTKPKKKKYFELLEKEFSKEELEYFGQYGITPDVLSYYRVVPLDGYLTENGKGKSYKVDRNEDEMMFAFKGEGFAKIYTPIPKSFTWVGNKPPDYYFGWNEVDQGDGKHFVLEHLIITGGEKDVLTLHALGYDNVISLNSETSALDAEFADKLMYHSEGKVIVLYDIDETGRKASKLLVEKHRFREVVLPNRLREKGGKDVSDYVAKGLDTEELKKLIAQAIEQEEEEEEEEEASEQPPPGSSDRDNPMPYLPEDIFDMLPDILKESCELFDDRRQKDLYLISALSVLSGCFPMLRGIYDDHETSCNLYSMIVAPPASGKGAMSWAKKLGHLLHEHIKEENSLVYKRIKDAEERERAIRRAEERGQEIPEKMEKGERVEDIEEVRRTLFIPADISVAAIVELLNDNFGTGIIFDSEADVVNRMFVTEWGQYSTILRKGFQSESISLMRKKDRFCIEVDFPIISVALSGTKDQLVNLVQEVDNGLFSRFIFYQFHNLPVWRDPWRHVDSKMEKFEEFSKRMLTLFLYLPDKIHFILKPDQQSEFNSYFRQWTQEVNQEREGTGIEILFRIGLITYRIAMLLTLLRRENEVPSKQPIERVECDLKDLSIALRIAETMKIHSYEIYNQLAGYPSKLLSFSKELREFYSTLPDTFTRKDANNIGTKMNVKLPTIEKWIEKFVAEKIIERTRYGQYSKVKIRK